MSRYNQLGKKIANPGAHIPHAAVALILKKRRKKQDMKDDSPVKLRTEPKKSYSPFPMEFQPENM